MLHDVLTKCDTLEYPAPPLSRCSSGPSSLAQLRDCGTDLVAACSASKLANWLPLGEDGGHIKSLMAILETDLPRLLHDALAQAVPRRALLELLDVHSSLYAALSCVASSSFAGRSYMSRATAAVLPLLQLLPEGECKSRFWMQCMDLNAVEGLRLACWFWRHRLTAGGQRSSMLASPLWVFICPF